MASPESADPEDPPLPCPASMRLVKPNRPISGRTVVCILSHMVGAVVNLRGGESPPGIIGAGVVVERVGLEVVDVGTSIGRDAA